VNTGRAKNKLLPEWSIFLFLALLLVVLSCKHDADKELSDRIATDSILSEEMMVLILSDLHTIEAAMVIKQNRGEYNDSTVVFLYNGLFTKYKITRERLDRSLEFYRRNTEKYLKLYERVIQELTDRENRFVKKGGS
jgi:hypothetical protein